jgi:hypothetical protein
MPLERGARGEAVHVVDAEVEGDTPVPVAREARAKPAISRAEVENCELPSALFREGNDDAGLERVERAGADGPLPGERAGEKVRQREKLGFSACATALRAAEPRISARPSSAGRFGAHA